MEVHVSNVNSSFLSDNDDGLAGVAPAVNISESLARLLEAVVAMFAARDLALNNQRRDLVVELASDGRRLAGEDDEALDGDAPLEDLVEVLCTEVNCHEQSHVWICVRGRSWSHRGGSG